MILDKEYEKKLYGFALYRSQETIGDKRPIVSGLYIERDEIGKPFPDRLKMTIESIESSQSSSKA